MNPPANAHRTPLRVRYCETDQMGVTHHGVYIQYFELARTDMMREHGLSYADMERRGLLLAVIDMGLQYRAPSRYDEPLCVETRLTEAGRVRVRFDYEVRREDESQSLVCSGHTVLACVRKDLSPQRIPAREREIMQGLVTPPFRR